SVFRGPGIAQVAHAVIYTDVCWSPVQRRRQCEIGGFSRHRAWLISGAAGNIDLELRRLRIVSTWCPISLDNSFRKQIVHRLTRPGNIGGKQMIKGAVLAHDNNDMFDGRDRVRVPLRRLADLSLSGAERVQTGGE